MRAEAGERRATTLKAGPGATVLPPPAEAEHLPCPRCDSTNTKFCYYNNYNFSQPRHFCKSCRRYWTQGGTLRDIPVGGGTRKSAKRPRSSGGHVTTSNSSTSSAVAAATSGSMGDHTFVSFSSLPELNMKPQVVGGGGMHVGGHVSVGSFTSLLNLSGGPQGGSLGLGGFGLGLGVGVGLGPGFEDGGFGAIGRGLWPLPELGYYNGGGVGDGAVGICGGNGGSTWQQLQGGDVDNQGGGGRTASGGGGFVSGDCFSFPELAISTPVYGLK